MALREKIAPNYEDPTVSVNSTTSIKKDKTEPASNISMENDHVEKDTKEDDFLKSINVAMKKIFLFSQNLKRMIQKF